MSRTRLTEHVDRIADVREQDTPIKLILVDARIQGRGMPFAFYKDTRTELDNVSDAGVHAAGMHAQRRLNTTKEKETSPAQHVGDERVLGSHLILVLAG